MSTRVLAAAALPGLLLAFCCAASAAEPTKGESGTAVYGGIKVGIDAATGRMRPLSDEESAALDRVVTATPQARSAARSVNTIAKPATIAAALQTQRAVTGGGNAMKVPMSEMSHVVAVRDAAGKITVQHADGTAVADAVAQPVVEVVQ